MPAGCTNQLGAVFQVFWSVETASASVAHDSVPGLEAGPGTVLIKSRVRGSHLCTACLCSCREVGSSSCPGTGAFQGLVGHACDGSTFVYVSCLHHRVCQAVMTWILVVYHLLDLLLWWSGWVLLHLRPVRTDSWLSIMFMSSPWT